MRYKYWVVFAVEQTGMDTVCMHTIPFDVDKPLNWGNLLHLCEVFKEYSKDKYPNVVGAVPVNIIPFKEDGTI